MVPELSEGDGDLEDFDKLLDGVEKGDPTAHQLEADQRDPVTGETADEAWEHYQRTGLVNPFHAVELQRRQSKLRAERREEEGTLLERAGFFD